MGDQLYIWRGNFFFQYIYITSLHYHKNNIFSCVMNRDIQKRLEDWCDTFSPWSDFCTKCTYKENNEVCIYKFSDRKFIGHYTIVYIE